MTRGSRGADREHHLSLFGLVCVPSLCAVCLVYFFSVNAVDNGAAPLIIYLIMLDREIRDEFRLFVMRSRPQSEVFLVELLASNSHRLVVMCVCANK